MIRYFRRYEKWIFWGIVIVILPTFSVTGIMFSTCGQRDTAPAGKIYGEEVPDETFRVAQERLGRFYQVIAPGRQERDDDIVWNHLIFLRQAEEAGVQVSDDELAEEVRRRFKDRDQARRAYERFEKEFPGFARAQSWQRERILQQLYMEEAANAKFSREEYEKTLEAVKLDPVEFEATLRERMRIEKLVKLVQASGKPDPEKVYESFQEEAHRRKAAYVVFKSDDHKPDEGKTSVEELKKYYDRHGDRFREPRKVDVEWVAVKAAGFEKDVPPLTEKELETRYEGQKERWRLPDAPSPGGTATAVTATAQPRYRPLAEVRREIESEVRMDRKLDLARKKAEEVRAGVLADLTAGKAVSLTAVAKAGGAEFGRSDLVEPIDLVAEKDILHMNLLNVVEKLGTSGPASLSETLTHTDGVSAFFLRLAERREPRTPPFDEIQAKVRESYFRGLEEELRKYHLDNASKYKTPASAAIEYVFVPFKRFEKDVPKDVTGTAREEQLRKKAGTLLGDVREAASAKGPDGKPRDIETVALEKGADHQRADVLKSGKDADLPADIRAIEAAVRLERGDDEVGKISPAIENDAKTGVFAYVVKSVKPEKQLTLEESKERVRRDVLDERAFERARDAADGFAKEAAPKPAEFRALAAAKGLKVADTAFVGRKDKVEGLSDSSRLVGGVFALAGVGDVGGPAVDFEGKTATVYRFVAKEPADPAKFKDREKDVREAVAADARDALVVDWDLRVRLEARQVDEAVLKEVYGLRYGDEGLAEVEAAHIWVAADAKTINDRLAEKAKKDAESTLAEIRAGARFDDLARKRSQDPGSRRRGGDLGFNKRGRMVPEFDAVMFALKPGELSEPVKTQFGWHLIQVVERRGDEVKARHILFRAERGEDEEGNPLPLDAETRKLAMDTALEKAKKAEARLQAGEEFAAVAKETTEEPRSGEKRAYDFEAPLERAAFAAKPGEATEVLGIGGKWHLVLVEELSSEGRGPDAVKPRVVRHIQAEGDRGKRTLDQIRNELVEKRATLEREVQLGKGAGGLRGVKYEYRKAFEEYAQKESAAPSGPGGGRVGVFRPDPDFERWGPAFREKVLALKDGETSGVFEGKDGYHIVKVIGRVKKSYDDAKKDVAGSLLESLEF